MGVLLQSGKHGGAVKIVPQLPGGDGLRPVRGQVGIPSPALLDGHTLLQQQRRKLVKAACPVKGFSDGLAQLLLVGFKLAMDQRLVVFQPFFVLPVNSKLPLFLRPILALGDAVCAAVEQVDLIEVFQVAQLHDLGSEMFHSRVGAAVLAPGFRVCGSVHVGQQGNSFNAQAVDDDVNMDISAVVMPVRVGADKGLVSGELLFTKPLAQLLRTVNGQPIVRAVPWVKADDIVVALYIFLFLIFAIPQIGAHTGDCKIFFAAVHCGNAVVLPRHKPPLLVQRGLHGELIVFKGQVFFCVAVVGVLRADMFERCQPLHLPFQELQTSRRQGRKPPSVPPRQAADRGCATRSASGLSD